MLAQLVEGFIGTILRGLLRYHPLDKLRHSL
jgi:hypothetical protein